MLNVISKRMFLLFVFIFMCIQLSGCATAICKMNSAGQCIYPVDYSHYQETGVASWYGKHFQRKRTSSGERYNMYALTAAHKTLPLSSKVLVTNLENGKKIIVRINDRGPFVHGRLIDLSYAAAKQLGMLGAGMAKVNIKVIN